MKRLVMAGVYGLFTLGLAAGASAAEVTWKGCGITKLAFMAEISKAYEAKTGIPVKLSGGGATQGIRAASAGTSDIGGTCRQVLKEGGAVHPEESNAVLTQVAWDAMVVIVHPSNPVENISVEQLKAIYDGTITNWNELGGPDKRIVLVTRDGKYSGVGHMFRMEVFGDKEYEFKARSLKVKSTGPLEAKVEKAEASLGIDGISSAKKREVKFLNLNGVAPSKDNIASGNYPLIRPLYLALNKSPSNPEAQKVLDFVLSDEGQAIISAQGTVNLAEGAALNEKWQAIKAKF
ncbi:phosphate ABC transporter substrate-binding protein, PhoT family [Magnetococcus marinus MC-1]|uniref:Phosphate ABC transporter substrate-binding protein, PhoT family n=1 Tax=Magnetococcus marinus (strain ATCC BAA-1437 / JCM 17883 / MC-1) TaxID=156889 RepID=A0L800_MAGMM|nr:phosphate ABC transporter substrate-binding protein [Magnetococcus marinus]ABK44093.1 phosphate ABC transporter substrate-binding protein, PhoT family [Magnetococcus marinus MC-1]